MSDTRTSKELDYPPKFWEYEAEWSKRGYEPHIATLLAKADWSEDMINWQEDEINRLHNEIEAGGSRERGTSPNRSCGTAGQSGPASSLQSTHEPFSAQLARRCLQYVENHYLGRQPDAEDRDVMKQLRAIMVGASQPPAADVQMAMTLISEVDCHLANAKWDKDATARRKLHQAHALLAPTAAVSLKDAYAKWRESHAGWCLSGPPEFGECNCSGSTKEGNQAEPSSSGGDLAAPTPRGSLPNSLGVIPGCIHDSAPTTPCGVCYPSEGEGSAL